MLYGDTVALGGLRAVMAQAPVGDRSLVVASYVDPAVLPQLDRAVRTELGRVLALPGGEIVRVATTSTFADAAADPATVRTLTEFASFEDIEAHARLSSGRWAAAGASPQEATLSTAAAAALKLAVGDRITLVNRLQPTQRVEVIVTGTWELRADDPYWLADPLVLDGSVTRGSYTLAGPFVVPDAELETRPFSSRLSFEWRGLPDPAGFRIDDVASTRTAALGLETGLKGSLPANTQFRITTGLPKILETVERSVLVSRTGVLLLVIQYAVLALYAIVLVAGMLSDRRRAETALFRTRGASTLHLLGMGVLEAVVFTGTAALAAPFVAIVVVRWLVASQAADGALGSVGSITRDAVVADVATALVGVLALTLPLLGGGPNLAGVRAAIARQTSRTLARRLGLDLVLVMVAAIALWQLRQYGAPLTRNARGPLGIDPLLVAAPAIGLLAGAVLATRILPRGLELAEGVLERSRGLVGAMGGRGLARRPLRYTRSALLLMLAASLGTFAVANVETWTRSQADQAAYQAGAPVRLTPATATVPDWALGSTLAGLTTVTGTMPVDRLRVDAGRTVRGGQLLALDADVAGAVVNPMPGDDPAALSALERKLAADRPSALGTLLPDGTTAVGIGLDAALEKAFDTGVIGPTDLSKFEGIRLDIVVEDGRGRFTRLSTPTEGVLAGKGQRLVIPLTDPGHPGAGFTGPLRLRAIEVRVDAPDNVGLAGTVELISVEATIDPSVDFGSDSAWRSTGLAATTPGWNRAVDFGDGQPQTLEASTSPWRLTFGDTGELQSIFGGSTVNPAVTFTATTATRGTVDAIANQAFIDATGAGVGSKVTTSLEGTPASVLLIGALDGFPTLDPAKPFLVVDGPTLADARLASSAVVAPPTEWWLATNQPTSVAAAITSGVDRNATIVTTAARRATLLADPIPRGVIGILGLGSLAALVFAAIGFIVSATVSTRERLVEFALLRALGLSGRQLSTWLALEHTVLLVVGSLAGIGLGSILAWLVLPFATLTASGAEVTPPPAVVIPLGSLLPIAAGAAAVLAATLLVVRRQLLGIRIGDVLRGQDE